MTLPPARRAGFKLLVPCSSNKAAASAAAARGHRQQHNTKAGQDQPRRVAAVAPSLVALGLVPAL